MAITFKEIITVEQLLEKNLFIPNYQRSYKWTQKNVNQLFNDILQASEKELSEYRIGTIVIHEHEDGQLDIVDGQQRTISLHLINNVLKKGSSVEIRKNKSHISKNYYEVIRLYEGLNPGQQKNFKKYFKENCCVIMIKIDNEMEAFQFFDSQNARGKALEAHDLLKAYHLREMRTDSERVKLNLIEKWESQMTKELAELFQRYLYRIKSWINKENATYFYRDGVHFFKGVPMNEQFNYIQYHKAAYLFIEKFNRDNTQELLAIDELIPFQIDQPILAGRRFFEFTLYYMNLKKKVEKIAIDMLPKSVSPKHTREQTGTRYVRELLQLLLLYFYDKFGIHNRNENIEKLFLKYSYQLRLLNYAVYEQSINKYALGNNKQLNYKLNLFTLIRDAKSPNDIEMIVIDDVNSENITNKYKTKYFEDLREKVGLISDGK